MIVDQVFGKFLNDFQESCPLTLAHPQLAGNPTYFVLGLLGEWGEVQRAVDWTQCEAEIGDCFWYIAMLAIEFDALLSTVVALAFNRDMRNYDETAMLELAQIAKRQIRDRTFNVETAVEMLALTTVHIINELMKSPRFHKVDPAEALRVVLQEVRNKLSSRSERGTIQGSGDYR